MKPRTRYGILAFGIFIFLIIAPLVAFYTSGFRIDFGKSDIVRTGILSATTEPSEAQISLNDEPRGTSPASIRFLKPGDYTVKINKPGYFAWQKRLSVKDGVVTWVNQDLDHLYLMLEDSQTQTLASSALDMATVDDRLLILKDKTLLLSEAPKFEAQTSLNLPLAATAIITTRHSDVVLLVGGPTVMLVSLNNQRVTDLTKLLVPGSAVTVLSSTHLISQEGQSAFLINASTGAKTLIEQNVLTLTDFDSEIYMLRRDGAQMSLVLRSINGDNISEARIIVSNLSIVTASQLIVTPQKHVYVFGQQGLYVINDKLESLYAGIVTLRHDRRNDTIIFQTQNELFMIDDSRQRPELITRYGGTIAEPRVVAWLGYSFFIQDDQIVALELDTRDSQNRYSLLQTQTPRKLSVVQDAKQLLVLDGGEVKLRQLRH